MAKHKPRTKNDAKDEKRESVSKSKSNYKKGNRDRDRASHITDPLSADKRSNNPNWYFTDRMLAEQVTQLSFQQLAGYSIPFENTALKVPNIVVLNMLPSPGVQLTGTYQKSALNIAAFRIYSKLSAYTGRNATYGPQDIATMILAFGDIISGIEWIRRAFGVAYQMNQRNRDYPKRVLETMGVDPTDLFNNYANYRTKFNTLVTMVNQIPIPYNIAYFDKCATMYEKVYLDQPSSMAQTIYMSPAWMWTLDETTYSGGTICKSIEWTHSMAGGNKGAQYLSVYLNQLDSMITAMLNSSTLQVVYTDLLNLATKMNVPFWRFDYLADGYVVVPEYNANFMLQVHNATTTEFPGVLTDESKLASGLTPNNDVYPDANNNGILYNPVFSTQKMTSGSHPYCTKGAIIDMLNDNPTLEDRVEVTRLISTTSGINYVTVGNVVGLASYALPDHYVTRIEIYDTNANVSYARTVDLPTTITNNASALSQITYGPRVYAVDSAQTGLSGVDYGDLNYYTTVDAFYMRRLHDFVCLGLYDLR